MEWKVACEFANKNGYDISKSGVGCGEDHPVHSVSWYDVVKWCNARSQLERLTPVYTTNNAVYKTGKIEPDVNPQANGYRLPTESEWEWAARGAIHSCGYIYCGSNLIDEVAWYRGNSFGAAVDMYSGHGTWPTGLKRPNELGLYDMSGNVQEWCYDEPVKSFRSIRGGDWQSSADECAMCFRVDAYCKPEYRHPTFGFRLARNLL